MLDILVHSLLCLVFFSFWEVIIFKILLLALKNIQKWVRYNSCHQSLELCGWWENSTNAHTNISRNFTKATREAQTKYYEGLWGDKYLAVCSIWVGLWIIRGGVLTVCGIVFSAEGTELAEL